MSIISDRVRELISTGIAIVAALAVATAVIYWYRLDAAQARIATQDQVNAQLMEANAANSATIADLTSQVQKSNDLAQNMLTLVAKGGEMDARTQEYLNQLVQSNEQIKALLATDLPDSVRGLFQQTPTGSKNSNGKGNPAAVPADTGSGHSTKDR